MTLSEAIKVLADHQEWRCGGDGPQTCPQALTEALDLAIAALAEGLDDLAGAVCDEPGCELAAAYGWYRRTCATHAEWP